MRGWITALFVDHVNGQRVRERVGERKRERERERKTQRKQQLRSLACVSVCAWFAVQFARANLLFGLGQAHRLDTIQSDRTPVRIWIGCVQLNCLFVLFFTPLFSLRQKFATHTKTSLFYLIGFHLICLFCFFFHPLIVRVCLRERVCVCVLKRESVCVYAWFIHFLVHNNRMTTNVRLYQMFTWSFVPP